MIAVISCERTNFANGVNITILLYKRNDMLEIIAVEDTTEINKAFLFLKGNNVMHIITDPYSMNLLSIDERQYLNSNYTIQLEKEI